MFIDYEEKTGDDGFVRTHFTEPGRRCTVHTWQLMDPHTGSGVGLRALEHDDVRLGDLPVKEAVAFLAVAVIGMSHTVAFKLDRGEIHRRQRNGWCPNRMHDLCSYEQMSQIEAEGLWFGLRDRFDPSDEDLWLLLAEDLRKRASY